MRARKKLIADERLEKIESIKNYVRIPAKINCKTSTKYINKYMLMAFKFSLLYNTSEKSRIETSLFIDLKSY